MTRAVEHDAAFLAALMTSIGEGVYAVGGDGRLTYMNPAAARMLGFGEEELLGRNMHDAVHHTDEAGRHRPEERCPLLSVIRTGRPVEVDEDVFVRSDGALLPVSYSSAPMVVDGAVVGAVVAFRDATERRAARRDRERLLADRTRVARALQRSLLPPRLPDVDGLELGVRFLPLGDDLLVGGDFYDAYRAGGGWMLALGDVCGKGPEAAAVTGLVRHTLRAVADDHPAPADALRRVNAVLLDELRGERFCTAVAVLARRGPDGFDVEACAAGHPLPLVLRAGGAVEALGEPGTLLGFFDEVRLTTATTRLQPGDALVLYTDGVEERGGTGAAVDLAGVIAPAAGASAREVADAVVDRALRAVRRARTDDLAVLAARVL